MLLQLLNAPALQTQMFLRSQCLQLTLLLCNHLLPSLALLLMLSISTCC